MPFSIQVEGMKELLHSMEKLPEKAADVAAMALYEGAGVMADAVSRSVKGIATEPFRYAAGGQKRKPSPEEKAIVENARKGVSKFTKSADGVYTNVGFKPGYSRITWNHARTNVRTKYKVSGGIAKQAERAGGGESSKPVEVIINSINHGTSFMEMQPFLRKAFSQKKRAAEDAIEAAILKHQDMLDPSK